MLDMDLVISIYLEENKSAYDRKLDALAAGFQIDEIAGTIASAVEEQSAATREISSNIQQASRRTTEITASISGVTAAAEKTGSVAGRVLSAANELSRQAKKLRGGIDSFLADVRTA